MSPSTNKHTNSTSSTISEKTSVKLNIRDFWHIITLLIGGAVWISLSISNFQHETEKKFDEVIRSLEDHKSIAKQIGDNVVRDIAGIQTDLNKIKNNMWTVPMEQDLIASGYSTNTNLTEWEKRDIVNRIHDKYRAADQIGSIVRPNTSPSSSPNKP